MLLAYLTLQSSQKMMLNILSTFLNGKNAKQKILIIFFISFQRPFCLLLCSLSPFLVLQFVSYLLYFRIFSQIFLVLCVCVCVCVMCVCTCSSIFFSLSLIKAQNWLNYSPLSLIAQLVMDREKVILWDVCCELM